MKIIAVKTLKQYWEKFLQAEQALLSWYEEVEAADWCNPNELKAQYRNASVITDKRVVFNIHGNSFRLIIDIEYRLKIDSQTFRQTSYTCRGIDTVLLKIIADPSKI